MTKRSISGAAAGLAALAFASIQPGIAHAVDMGGYNAAGQPAPFAWNGAYVGATVGYSSAMFDVSNIEFEGTPALPDFSFPGNGIIGGVEGGFNMQMGQAVVGVEGDFSFTGVEGTYTDTIDDFASTGRLKSLATVRGRLGFAAGRALLFATGGVAFGNVEAQLDDGYGGPVITTTDSQNHVGWTAGGGLEVAVTDHVSIKGEALYYDLGSRTYTFNEGVGGWNPITVDAAVTGWLARVGANLHF